MSPVRATQFFAFDDNFKTCFALAGLYFCTMVPQGSPSLRKASAGFTLGFAATRFERLCPNG